MTRKVAKLVLELSNLMREAGEIPLEVFCIVNNLLEGRHGHLFVVSVEGVKIGFGCLVFGLNDSRFKQLQYYAIKPEYRSKGLGLKALEAVLQQEVGAEGSCGVACERNLKEFYQKAGFTMDVDDGDRVGLVMTDRTLSNEQKVIQFYEIDRLAINKNIPILEQEYGIELEPI